MRAIPRETPAKEVVALGKKKGVTLSENYVYAIRSSSGAKAQTAGKSLPKARGKGHNGTAASNGMSAAEAQLRDAIADLGLVKAGEILAGVKATIRGPLQARAVQDWQRVCAMSSFESATCGEFALRR